MFIQSTVVLRTGRFINMQIYYLHLVEQMHVIQS